jgi:hypothetical protein
MHPLLAPTLLLGSNQMFGTQNPPLLILEIAIIM